jgi:uncharacterized membrane protein
MNEERDVVDRQTLRSDWPVFLILTLGFAFGLWALPRLPEQVPVHWGISGEPDRFGPAWEGALLAPLIATGVYLLMLFLPVIDPRRRNYQRFAGFYRLLRLAVPALLVLIQLNAVSQALGYPGSPVRMIRIAGPIFFLLIGNHLGQIRSNYFVGIRTPWTLASERVWIKTHRAAARLWVACSLLALASALLPTIPGTILFVGLIGIMCFVPVIHSYLLFRREKASGQA